jgi:O-antigen ligase
LASTEPLTAKLSAWILFATVVAAPLPFGSSDPVAVAFWCAVLGIALIFAPVTRLERGHFTLISMGVVVIAVYTLVLHEQLSSRPWLAIANPHPVWRQASELLGEPLEPSVSIARNQPFIALGTPLVSILALAGGLLIGTDEKRAHQLVRVIAWSGACYAIYGIYQLMFDPTRILWREKQAYVDALTSTFINRNTAAAYFGSCSVVWLLLISEHVRTRMRAYHTGWRQTIDQLLSEMPRQVLIGLSMLILCLSAMFMTGSRAGVLLSLLALIVAFNIHFRRQLKGWAQGAVAVMASAAIGLIVFEFLGDRAVERFNLQGIGAEGRLSTYLSTLKMIADHPWFGTGQGTFAWAFPPYRSSDVSMWGVWDIAHNTLLEIAADMGVPIAGLVVLAWFVIFAVLIGGVTRRGRGRMVPTAALAVAALASAHSLVDFSLQIPGYSIVALALVGAGLAQSCVNHEGSSHRRAGVRCKRDSKTNGACQLVRHRGNESRLTKPRPAM